jgi:hypothetical protein
MPRTPQDHIQRAERRARLELPLRASQAPAAHSPDQQLGTAVLQLTRRCAHCEIGWAPEGEVFCGAECTRDAALLAKLAVELRDRRTWTPEAWTILLQALEKVPTSKLKAAAGVTRNAVHYWRTGKSKPRPEKWAVLAGFCVMSSR